MNELIGWLINGAVATFWVALAEVGQWLWSLLNSNFSAALAGAGVGAYAAQRIAEQSERKRKALEEIRATNAAISLTFTLANLFLNVKEQHLLRLVKTYHEQRQKVLVVEEQRCSGGVPPAVPISIQADFQDLSLPPTLVDVLKQLLFERISPSGKSLIAFTTLTQSMGGLVDAMEGRNRVIIELREKQPDSRRLIEVFFGIADSAGHVDGRYFSYIGAIDSYNDDCIFYSQVLLDGLVRHGKRLSLGLKDAPLISEPDFSKAAAKGLLPSPDRYQEWISGIRSPETSSERTWVVAVAELFGDSA